jgi:hypothetical protein
MYITTVQQYSTHLHTNSTAVQYTFTYKQYTGYTESTQNTHTQTNKQTVLQDARLNHQDKTAALLRRQINQC